MANDQAFHYPNAARTSRGSFSTAEPRGKVIDQDGREIPTGSAPPFGQGTGDGGFHFDFRHFDFRSGAANPFAQLTREQRLKRLEAVAKLLDVAFILPGTNIRYGIDGIIGLIPVVGDIIATGLSLWLVHEARALGAPWHVTARMLANVAFQGTVGMVPVAGDAIDVLFRANMRNARLLRRWIETQPRM